MIFYSTHNSLAVTAMCPYGTCQIMFVQRTGIVNKIWTNEINIKMEIKFVPAPNTTFDQSDLAHRQNSCQSLNVDFAINKNIYETTFNSNE